MFSNVYDPTDMQKAVKERFDAYFQVGEARWSAGLPEAEDQMLWASYALRTLICEDRWEMVVTSDKLLQEAHGLLLASGLPLRGKHMHGVNKYVVASRV